MTSQEEPMAMTLAHGQMLASCQLAGDMPEVHESCRNVPCAGRPGKQSMRVGTGAAPESGCSGGRA